MIALGFTHVLNLLGPNDIASSRSPTAYLADVAWLDNLVTNAGLKFVQGTIPPRPATSDASQSVNSLDSAYAGNNGGLPPWQAVNQINGDLRSRYSASQLGDVHKSVATPTTRPSSARTSAQ